MLMPSTPPRPSASSKMDGSVGYDTKSPDSRQRSSSKSSVNLRVSTLEMIDEWPLVVRPKEASPDRAAGNPKNRQLIANSTPRVQWQKDVRNTNSPVQATMYAIDSSSSFHLYKGLCKGAKEVLRGGPGVKHLHKPVHRTLSRVVARCVDCRLELDNSLVEADQTNEGNQTTPWTCLFLLCVCVCVFGPPLTSL